MSCRCVGARSSSSRTDVPIDPYALGLLLGDGCLTTVDDPVRSPRRTPSSPKRLQDVLSGVQVRHKGGYRLRAARMRAGAAAVHRPNPVTAAASRPGTVRARSRRRSSFRPCTSYNSAAVRLGRLAGTSRHRRRPRHAGRAVLPDPVHDLLARVCATMSMFLVRSLGGVAYWRRRSAAGRKPGFAQRATGRAPQRRVRPRDPAAARTRALPAERASATSIDRFGGGRPMRFIESIEPAGEMETVCIQVAAADSLYVTDDFIAHAQHAQRRLHHSRRGAEHHAGADEDVPDPARLRLEDRGHRRRHPDRPARRHPQRPAGRARHPHRRRRRQLREPHQLPTSSGTGWSARSSTPTPARTRGRHRPPGLDRAAPAPVQPSH